MRKWMSERLKRRKKPPEKAAASEAAAVPLQPKYFETESAPASPLEVPEVEPQLVEPIEPVEMPPPSSTMPATSVQPQSQANGEAARRSRRRRRGRGGRGRARDASPAAAQAVQSPAPASPQTLPGPVAIKATTPTSQPAAPRVAKGTVVLAIGLPGSGKSSWFKRHNITPLSSDLLRAILFDDPTEQRFQDLVFSNMRSMLKARLIARRPLNYVDATNLTPQERHNWIKLAQDYQYEVQAVFFDVPAEVCLERNRRRERAVPEDVVRRMAAKLRPPTFEEGFAKITMVKVKKKDGEPVVE
jgi:predicted kinase